MRRTLLAILVTALAGCPGKADPNPRPKIGELRPAEPVPDAPAEPGAGAEPDADGGRHAVMAHVRIVELPLRARLDDAWAETSAVGLREDVVDLWQRNRMRAGLLDRETYPAFAAKIPTPTAGRILRIWGAKAYGGLALTPPLADPADMSFVLRWRRVRKQRIVGGQFRFLAKVWQEGGERRLTLIPQHHKRKATIRPRGPDEKELDGWVIDPLQLDVAIGKDQMLAVALKLPPEDLEPPKEPETPESPGTPESPTTPETPETPATPEAPAPRDTAGSDDPAPSAGEGATGADDPSGETADDTPDPQPPAQAKKPQPIDMPHLGGRLLTYKREGAERQIMLLITVSEAKR